MSAMTDYLENQLAKHLFRTGSYTKPTTLYIGLFTSDPGELGAGTEVSGGSYARVALPPSDANWALADGVVTNAVDVTFMVPTASWGTVTHVGIFDQSNNMLFHGALTLPKLVNNGDTAPLFPAGTIVITIDAAA